MRASNFKMQERVSHLSIVNHDGDSDGGPAIFEVQLNILIVSTDGGCGW